jgi:hypothetical protein
LAHPEARSLLGTPRNVASPQEQDQVWQEFAGNEALLAPPSRQAARTQGGLSQVNPFYDPTTRGFSESARAFSGRRRTFRSILRSSDRVAKPTFENGMSLRFRNRDEFSLVFFSSDSRMARLVQHFTVINVMAWSLLSQATVRSDSIPK